MSGKASVNGNEGVLPRTFPTIRQLRIYQRTHEHCFSAHLFQQKVGDFAAVRLTSARKLDLEILALQGRQNTSVGNSDRNNKVIVKIERVIISGTSEYFFHYSEVFFVERYVYIMVKPVGTWE